MALFGEPAKLAAMRHLATLLASTPMAVLCACTDVGDPVLASSELSIPSGPLSYDGDIRPILLDNGCLGCHQAGGNGGLDVTDLASLHRGGNSGRPAIVPCDHGASYLWYRIRWCEMPMPGYPHCVDPLDVAIVAAWIDQGGGATYDPSVCPDAAVE